MFEAMFDWERDAIYSIGLFDDSWPFCKRDLSRPRFLPFPALTLGLWWESRERLSVKSHCHTQQKCPVNW